MADYDNVSGIGDITGKVIEGVANSVISTANDTVKNILNLDNSKNKNDNTKRFNSTNRHIKFPTSSIIFYNI